MRILYGVVGEGMGHAMRSRVILEELVKHHEVQVVVSGRAHDYLAKSFGERLRIQKIWGLHIVYEDNEVQRFKTVLSNARGAVRGWPKNAKAYFDIARSFEPQVVISDFESWSYLFAKNWLLPVISIDNMQVINRCTHPPEVLDGYRGDFQVTKQIVKGKLPGCFHYHVTTFFYPPIRKARTSLHPPILRPQLLEAKAERGDHLLVYQTSTSNDRLPEVLKQTGLECRVYGLRRDLREEVVDGNLIYRPFSEQGFVDDLRTARGVIAGGGFTLMGEAVYLRKPMLSVPVKRQFEQVLNARYLEHAGYGQFASEIDRATVNRFVEAIPHHETALADYQQDGNRSLLESLEQTIQRAARAGRDGAVDRT